MCCVVWQILTNISEEQVCLLFQKTDICENGFWLGFVVFDLILPIPCCDLSINQLWFDCLTTHNYDNINFLSNMFLYSDYHHLDDSGSSWPQTCIIPIVAIFTFSWIKVLKILQIPILISSPNI
jgi:hypothetical protein